MIWNWLLKLATYLIRTYEARKEKTMPANDNISLVEEIKASTAEVLAHLDGPLKLIEKKAEELHSMANDLERQVNQIMRNAETIKTRLIDFHAREKAKVDEMLNRMAKHQEEAKPGPTNTAQEEVQ